MQELPGLVAFSIIQGMPQHPSAPRLAARALIVHDDRLLLVNAYPATRGSDLWCAPGGGVETGTDLRTNVAREVHEECGLRVDVGALAMVSEFHDPKNGFHQVELFFRAGIAGGALTDDWQDPGAVVTTRRFFSRKELREIRYRPTCLPDVAFSNGRCVVIDPLHKMAD